MSTQLERELNNLILQTFLGDSKRGNNWIHRHFSAEVYTGNDRLTHIIICLKSKRDQKDCPIHNKLHDIVI